jgi:predicted metalloendopeptidase
MQCYFLSGKNYGKDGTRESWWNIDTLRAYEDRAQCFVHQYSKYEINGKRVQCTAFSIASFETNMNIKILNFNPEHCPVSSCNTVD